MHAITDKSRGERETEREEFGLKFWTRTSVVVASSLTRRLQVSDNSGDI